MLQTVALLPVAFLDLISLLTLFIWPIAVVFDYSVSVSAVKNTPLLVQVGLVMLAAIWTPYDSNDAFNSSGNILVVIIPTAHKLYWNHLNQCLRVQLITLFSFSAWEHHAILGMLLVLPYY